MNEKASHNLQMPGAERQVKELVKVDDHPPSSPRHFAQLSQSLARRSDVLKTVCDYTPNATHDHG